MVSNVVSLHETWDVSRYLLIRFCSLRYSKSVRCLGLKDTAKNSVDETDIRLLNSASSSLIPLDST